MALRRTVDLRLLYQHQCLLRTGRSRSEGENCLRSCQLCFLYNRERAWEAARNVANLIETGPAELERYRPPFSYQLLEEPAYAETHLVGMQNPVAALIRLENSREPSDVRRVVEALAD